MPTTEANKADIAEVTVLAEGYGKKMTQSDWEALANLYAPDAVIMAEHSAPVIGAAEIRNTYQSFLQKFTVNATVTADEVVQMAPDWIFVRCHSSGTTTAKDTGQTGPVIANQELFIFQKINGSWKIARYCFTSRIPQPLAIK